MLRICRFWSAVCPQSICNQFTRGNCSGADCSSKLFHLKRGSYPARLQFWGLGSVHCCFHDQTQCNSSVSLPRIDEPALPNSVLMRCIEHDWHVGRENKPKENRRTKCLSNYSIIPQTANAFDMIIMLIYFPATCYTN